MIFCKVLYIASLNKFRVILIQLHSKITQYRIQSTISMFSHLPLQLQLLILAFLLLQFGFRLGKKVTIASFLLTKVAA